MQQTRRFGWNSIGRESREIEPVPKRLRNGKKRFGRGCQILYTCPQPAALATLTANWRRVVQHADVQRGGSQRIAAGGKHDFNATETRIRDDSRAGGRCSCAENTVKLRCSKCHSVTESR